MRNQNLLLIASSTGLFLAVGHAVAQDTSPCSEGYTITLVPPLPGGETSVGRAINNLGQVAGISRLGGFDHGFLWSGGDPIDIGGLGGDRTTVTDLNDASQVVGYSEKPHPENPDYLQNRGFIWEDGVMAETGHLGGSTSQVFCINDAGKRVGISDLSPNGRSVVLSYDTTNVALFDPGSILLNSYASGINARDEMVGYQWVDAGTTFERFRAVSWHEGVLSELGFDADHAFAADNNDIGDAVGYAYTADSTIGVLWAQGGSQASNIGNLGGSPGVAYPSAINNDGFVVGTSTDVYGTPHAFIWANGVGMVDLNDLLEPGSGWLLTTANDINDLGQIVGVGQLLGQTRAFVISACELIIDSDGDGTPDELDGCPSDPNKVEPGACGCGEAETDTNGDGWPDCITDPMMEPCEFDRFIGNGLASDSEFGSGISAQGDTLIIGAPGPYSSVTAGSALAFRREAGRWVFEQTLLPSLQGDIDFFGRHVVVNGDIAMVQASSVNTQSGNRAHVYTRNGPTWTEIQILQSPDGDTSRWFGKSFSFDGLWLAVGSIHGNLEPGRVFIYRWNGTAFEYMHSLTAPAGVGTGLFGKACALEGDTLIVGDEGGFGPVSASGVAFVYGLAGDTWELEQELYSPGLQAFDAFGHGLAFSGETLVVGAAGTSDDAGAVYVFECSASTWAEQARFSPYELRMQDMFGTSLSLSGDSILVGSMRDDDVCQDGDYCDSGAAYLYRRYGESWLQEAKLTAADATTNSWLGRSVHLANGSAYVSGSLSDGRIVVEFAVDGRECGTVEALEFNDCNSNGIDDQDELDADGDGFIDGCDGCPSDSAKTEPGPCGCGIGDNDGDADGVADCIDNCPFTSNPMQGDSDADGVGDACDDASPGDPTPDSLPETDEDTNGSTNPTDEETGFGSIDQTGTESGVDPPTNGIDDGRDDSSNDNSTSDDGQPFGVGQPTGGSGGAAPSGAMCGAGSLGVIAMTLMGFGGMSLWCRRR